MCVKTDVLLLVLATKKYVNTGKCIGKSIGKRTGQNMGKRTGKSIGKVRVKV